MSTLEDVFDRMTDCRLAIDAIDECVTPFCDVSVIKRTFEALETTLKSALTELANANAAHDAARARTQSDGIVVITLEDEQLELTTLDRHLLYCMDDARKPSTKYNHLHIAHSMEGLTKRRLVCNSELTERGKLVVAALRARHA